MMLVCMSMKKASRKDRMPTRMPSITRAANRTSQTAGLTGTGLGRQASAGLAVLRYRIAGRGP